MDGVTKRQRQILNFITKEVEKKGYPPSIREIGKRMGISSLRGVTIHLDALEKKGYIKRNSSARSIKILNSNKETITSIEVIKLPLVGRVAAGEPILAEENIEDWIPIPKTMVKNNKNTFLLKVNGDSMTGDHIMDGDLVIVKPQPVVDNGDIVYKKTMTQEQLQQEMFDDGHDITAPVDDDAENKNSEDEKILEFKPE